MGDFGTGRAAWTSGSQGAALRDFAGFAEVPGGFAAALLETLPGLLDADLRASVREVDFGDAP
ncbi:hypothetical protein GCM10023307_28370 [Lysobacter hankyongensis]|uniref:Uncharacterized protein n=1 Tax=Lysobacter hankyongensis TaxID=1176535 RepID=A0ABP9BY81_9GAMM